MVVTIANASYATIPAGGTRENFTPFQLRTEPTFPCGGTVELELVIAAPGEGLFAIPFHPASGVDCLHPSGGCESCLVVSGAFTGSTPTLFRFLDFVGAPSLCYPPKSCPGMNALSDTTFVPFLTHRFTNAGPNELCLTARLRFGCPAAPGNALGAAAYLGFNAANDPCLNYLGDSGADGTQPFSFRVPAHTNFFLLVSARDPVVVCPTYTLELFGLPCPAPRLDITRDAAPDKVLLRWSTAYPEYHLQTTNVLRPSGPNAFINLPGLPSIVNGKYTVTNAASSAKQFYRLAK